MIAFFYFISWLFYQVLEQLVVLVVDLFIVNKNMIHSQTKIWYKNLNTPIVRAITQLLFCLKKLEIIATAKIYPIRDMLGVISVCLFV